MKRQSKERNLDKVWEKIFHPPCLGTLLKGKKKECKTCGSLKHCFQRKIEDGKFFELFCFEKCSELQRNTCLKASLKPFEKKLGEEFIV